MFKDPFLGHALICGSCNQGRAKLWCSSLLILWPSIMTVRRSMALL